MTDQLDLFIASAADVTIKDSQDLMTRSWFSLSKNKRTTPIEHHFGDSWIKISAGSGDGIATCWDQDIILFIISHWMRSLNEGQNISRRVSFTGYEFWKFIDKKRLSGTGYRDLYRMMERLHHTFVETNIRQDNKRRHHSFNWLPEIKQEWRDDRHVGYEVVVADWLYDAVKNQKMVLTMDRQYFTITSGIDRFLYQFCRKTCGWKSNDHWFESFELIYKKSGSLMRKADFYKSLRKTINRQSVYGYILTESKISGRISLVIDRDSNLFLN